MSIASAITSLQSRVADAYTSVGNKGGTIPQVQDTVHLPAAIASIPSGGASSKFGATIEQVFQTVTENDETTLNMWGGVTSLTFTGVTTIPNNGMAYRFYGSPVTSVSFPALTSAGTSAFQSSFQGCTSLTSASFPVLTTVSGDFSFQNAFFGCTSLTTVSFPELTTISGPGAAKGVFSGCTSLTNVSFPKLESISGSSTFSSAFGEGNSFYPASGVTTLAFSALTTIISNATSATSAMFNSNKTLTRIDFPVLKSMKKTAGATSNNLTYIFTNCTALTELHFGSANQAVIEASDGYATKWGAPNANCTIYFDL